MSDLEEIIKALKQVPAVHPLVKPYKDYTGWKMKVQMELRRLKRDFPESEAIAQLEEALDIHLETQGEKRRFTKLSETEYVEITCKFCGKFSRKGPKAQKQVAQHIANKHTDKFLE
jgi:hypothetical protein